MLRTFKLYWINGKIQEVSGITLSKALESIGHNLASIHKLDWYLELGMEQQVA